MEKTGMPLTEVDEKAKKIFIGDGNDQELLKFLVEELGNIYDILSSNQELTPGDVETLNASFSAKLNEKLASFTVEQGLAIAEDFSKRAQVEFFARVSAEERAEARSSKGPFLKWVFVYQNIIGILVPSPRGGCGGCGGHGHHEHKCECGEKCHGACAPEKDKS